MQPARSLSSQRTGGTNRKDGVTYLPPPVTPARLAHLLVVVLRKALEEAAVELGTCLLHLLPAVPQQQLRQRQQLREEVQHGALQGAGPDSELWVKADKE